MMMEIGVQSTKEVADHEPKGNCCPGEAAGALPAVCTASHVAPDAVTADMATLVSSL